MEKLAKRSLYTPDVYRECVNRIEQVKPGSQPLWGSMNAAQMLAHCAEIQEVSNGKALNNTPFLARLFKGMIRKMVVNDKPYPKNSRTHPQYKQIDERDFDAEKNRLLKALEKFVNDGPDNAEKNPHPLFGNMTADEKGWSMYKHLNHHLAQFGV